MPFMGLYLRTLLFVFSYIPRQQNHIFSILSPPLLRHQNSISFLAQKGPDYKVKLNFIMLTIYRSCADGRQGLFTIHCNQFKGFQLPSNATVAAGSSTCRDL